MQVENGDDVIPSWFLEQLPGALRTSFFYDGKYARVVANVEWRLPSPARAAGPAPGYYASGIAGFCNGEWRM